MIKFLNKINKIIFFFSIKQLTVLFQYLMINKNDLISQKLINKNEENIVDLFEEKFANMIGSGFVKSYSAGSRIL